MNKGVLATAAAIGVAVVAIGFGAYTYAQSSPGPAAATPPPSEPASTASGNTSPSASPTPPDLAWGPSQAQWDAALGLAQGLSLEEAAGQVIMADISHPEAAPAAELVASRHLGGVIIMGGAVKDEDQVRELTAAIAENHVGRDWPVMIATDEEGGVVQRLKPVLGYVSAFMAAGANGNADEIRAYYAGLGAQMGDLNFYVNMAPVGDVTIGLKDPTIRTRSAGSDPQEVAAAVDAAWQGLDAGAVLPVIKHFPGHGSVTTDSHEGLPRQQATIGELEQRDLVPFVTAINSGAPAIMMAHIQVSEWGKAPTSVNPKAYAYLREELGFTGLIMTDAMNMDAITDQYKPGAATVAAISAGADMVLMPANTDAAIKALVAAVTSGKLDRARLDDAAARVILAAQRARWAQDAHAPERPTEFVEGSIVVAAKNCESLIGSSVNVVGGTAYQRKTLLAALADHGVKRKKSGATILLMRGDRPSGTADVVVAMGGPWGLPKSQASVYAATWGEGATQLRALAAVLAGEVTPRGTWPVPVKLPYAECS